MILSYRIYAYDAARGRVSRRMMSYPYHIMSYLYHIGCCRAAVPGTAVAPLYGVYVDYRVPEYQHDLLLKQATLSIVITLEANYLSIDTSQMP